MYIPKSFAVEDTTTLYALIESYDFATLASSVAGVPFATHVPLLLDQRTGAEESPRLLGHMARANPHWHEFDSAAESLAIFHGPHAYVSPSWYRHHPSVPTWNYAVVHVYGVPSVIDEPVEVRGILDRLVARHEANVSEPWSGELPDDFRTRMMAEIVAFELPVTRIEGKLKLGQNRPEEDSIQTLRALEGSQDSGVRALAELTRRQLRLEDR